ncbi:metal-dependent hydrolase [Mycobacterium decipiens]|uniref:metal-dependent hydrolase n=1 Tax=Mycobacterium decipiens TaxID=1430326 RepID=UPI001F610782|nr:metal-dependent hydrolase [Mycobacterium decipiens]
MKTRRIAFSFEHSARSKRHFVAGDIALSHLVALLSAIFPSGEECFVLSVRRYTDQITDPVLKQQVAGFIGQEKNHGMQHRNLNGALEQMGYWVTRVLGAVGVRLVKLVKSNLDRIPDTVGKVLLADTAAMEHFTAVLGKQALTTPWVQEQLTDPEVRAMLNWHAIEEMEHKAVAFDVYRYVGGTERMRILSMVAILTLLGGPIFFLLASIATDSWAWRHPIKTLRSLIALPRSPLFEGIVRKILVYLKPGFHPDDVDDSEALQKWREEYFGPNGLLLGHLK